MIRKLRRLVRIVGFGLFVAAISQEMAKPEAERTWHGKVGGVVPYDFRPPTWERIRQAYWNPDDERLFTERVLGVGWAINLYRARELMLSAYKQLMGATAPASQRWRNRTSRAPKKAADNS
jgi:hypothetical protein